MIGLIGHLDHEDHVMVLVDVFQGRELAAELVSEQKT